MLYGSRTTNDYLTHITIYCPLSEERPLRYKESTTYDIRLFEEDFASLQAFKNAIKDRTRAGFLRSQFFRVTFDENITSDTHTFLGDDDAISQAFDANRKLPWHLIIVRYTKVQACKLRDKLKRGEQDELDILTKQKRRYNRVNPRQKDAAQDTNQSASQHMGGDGYLPSLCSSSTMTGTLTNSLTSSGSLVTTQRHGCLVGSPLGSGSQLHKGIHHSSFDGDGIRSLVDSAGSTARDLGFMDYSGTTYGSTDDTGELRQQRLQDVYEVMRRIHEETPLAKLFSPRAIETWAKKIVLEEHGSFTVPPPSFPIPDLYKSHYWRHVTVQADLQSICMLYAAYLSDNALKEAIAASDDEEEKEWIGSLNGDDEATSWHVGAGMLF